MYPDLARALRVLLSKWVGQRVQHHTTLDEVVEFDHPATSAIEATHAHFDEALAETASFERWAVNRKIVVLGLSFGSVFHYAVKTLTSQWQICRRQTLANWRSNLHHLKREPLGTFAKFQICSKNKHSFPRQHTYSEISDLSKVQTRPRAACRNNFFI